MAVITIAFLMLVCFLLIRNERVGAAVQIADASGDTTQSMESADALEFAEGGGFHSGVEGGSDSAASSNLDIDSGSKKDAGKGTDVNIDVDSNEDSNASEPTENQAILVTSEAMKRTESQLTAYFTNKVNELRLTQESISQSIWEQITNLDSRAKAINNATTFLGVDLVNVWNLIYSNQSNIIGLSEQLAMASADASENLSSLEERTNLNLTELDEKISTTLVDLEKQTSTNLLDLKEKTNASIAENLDRITGNSLSISANSSGVTSNREAIATNREAIVANSETIVTNSEAIATNKQSITENTQAITANENLITANGQKIIRNVEEIDNNRSRISNLESQMLSLGNCSLSYDLGSGHFYITYTDPQNGTQVVKKLDYVTEP